MERLAEELTCAVCRAPLRAPRVLPCSHTFCGPCLQRLLPALRPRCPSCERAREQQQEQQEQERAREQEQQQEERERAREQEQQQEERAREQQQEQQERAREQEQQQEERERAREQEQQQQQEEPGTCSAHPRQPLNIYCLRERQLVCGRCLTIGQHRGHPIDDLGSAHGRAREAWGRLREELADPSRSEVRSCAERLRQHKARCQGTLRSHREAVLRCFKELGDALEQKKAALLSALDEVERCVSEKYDPLIEEVDKLKLEENELKELHSALQEEESPLLFLEKLQGLQLRLQALREKQLPEPEPVEVQPSVEKALQDLARAAVGQLHRIPAPKLQLAHHRSAGQTAAAALWAALTEPSVLLLILTSVVFVWHEEISSAAIPAPLVHLWRFLQDCCTSLQDKVYELCYTSALPLQLCRTIFPDDFD